MFLLLLLAFFHLLLPPNCSSGSRLTAPEEDLCADGETMRICVPEDYMKFELPEDGDATHVLIGVDIKDIPKVNDKDFSITINAYFMVKWRDQRLLISKRNKTRGSSSHLRRERPTPMTTSSTTTDSFLGSSRSPLRGRRESGSAGPSSTPSSPPLGSKTIHVQPALEEEEPAKLTAVNLQILRSLWLPDVEILNLKEFETHSVLSKLEGIWIDEKNMLIYALATRITFICPMKFNAFPMDIQICLFQVGSFNYDMAKMVFTNDFVPKEQEAIKSILDYEIEINDLRPEQTHYTALGMNYSVAGFEMILTRKISFYIVTYYLPSGLFVVVSWISFLVNPEVIPGRMTLLVTIFLVLINIFNTIQTNSPKAEGLTAIEAWVIACIIFVFGALGEYTVILLKIKLKKLQPRRTTTARTRRRQQQQQSQQPQPQSQPTNNAGVQTTAGSTVTVCNNQSTSTASRLHPTPSIHLPLRRDNYGRTDLLFLVVFPVLFLCFNVFYWTSLYWWRWAESPEGQE